MKFVKVKDGALVLDKVVAIERKDGKVLIWMVDGSVFTTEDIDGFYENLLMVLESS